MPLSARNSFDVFKFVALVPVDIFTCFADDDTFISLGTEYYFAFPKNLESLPSLGFADPNLRVKASSNDMSTANVGVYDRSGDVLYLNGFGEVDIDIDNELMSIVERDKGLRLDSGGKGVSVVAFSEEFTSADTFLVLPPVYLPDINYEYFAVSVDKSENETTYGSAILIVASEDNTNITLIPTADLVNISIAQDITGSGESGERLYVVLGKMDTLYISSLDNLSGTRVVANKPITFISGHECGTVPTGESFCDHLFEQIPPTTTWGKEFYTVPLSARNSFDVFKFVASTDDTSITGVCGPINTTMSYFISTAGDILSLRVSSTQFCSFASSNPVLLVQFAVATSVDNVNADPFMLIVPPSEQYRNDYYIPTFQSRYGDLSHFVNIAIKANFDRNVLRLNGDPIAGTWTRIFCQENNENPCAHGIQMSINQSNGSYILSSQQPDASFGVTVYSFGIRVGQGHVGGLKQQPVTCELLNILCYTTFYLVCSKWKERHISIYVHSCVMLLRCVVV